MYPHYNLMEDIVGSERALDNRRLVGDRPQLKAALLNKCFERGDITRPAVTPNESFYAVSVARP